jgi:hypothetical protein
MESRARENEVSSGGGGMVPDVLGQVGAGASPSVLPVQREGALTDAYHEALEAKHEAAAAPTTNELPKRPQLVDAPTPETNSIVRQWMGPNFRDDLPRFAELLADFARRLERERDAARLSLKIAMEAECFDCDTFKQERDEAQRQLKVVEARAAVDQRRHESELREERAEAARLMEIATALRDCRNTTPPIL